MNRLFVKCLVIVSVFLVASCAKDLTPEEHLIKARQYIEAGDYASATIELKNAAVKDPVSVDTRYELARVALIQGDGLTAEKEVRRAIDLGMPADQLTLMLIEAIYLQGEFDRVLDESEHFPVVLDAPVMADIKAYRAHALLQQQQYKLADAAIAEALGYNENSVLAVLAKASYEAQVGRRETAMTLATRATEIDPTSAEAWALIGDLYMAEDDLPAAKEAYDKAVANRVYVSLLQARRAFVLAQLDQFPAAKGDIRSLNVAGFSKNPYVNFVKGYIAFQEADYAAATAALEKSTGGNPDDPVSKLYLVASYMQEGKLEQAREIADKLYGAIPNSIEIARMYASLDMQQQDFGAARAILNTLLEEGDDALALGMLGSMALMEGDGDLAVDYFQRLQALSPEDDQSVQQLLNLAMTMRGDFVSQVSAAAEQQVAPENFDRVLLSAGIALREGRLKEALVIAENLQQQFPGRVEPLNMLASIYLSVGDWRKGKSFLEQTLSLQPLEPSAVKALAKIYLREGEEARALQLVTAYLKENPQDQEAIGILSELIVAANTYPQAEKQLIELLDQNPQNLELKARLARLYFASGHYEQVSVLTENLTDDDIRRQPSLMELRGKSLVNLGKTNDAAKVWEKWVNLSPDSVLANYYYAQSLAGSNQLENALKFLKISRQLNPGYLPVRIALIRLTAEAGDLDEAFVEMQQLQSELTEDRADVLYLQGWLSTRAGHYEDAAQALQQSLSLQPMPETALLLYATLNSQGRADEALSSLENSLDAFPQNLPLMTVLGQNYLASNDTEKAIGIYRRQLEIEPKFVLALNNLAWLLRESDLEQALEYGERARVLAPENPYVLSTLGTLLVAKGQTAEGEQMLRKAVTLHPDNMQVKLDLGRLLIGLGKQDAARPYLEEVIASASDGLKAEAQGLLQ